MTQGPILNSTLVQIQWVFQKFLILKCALQFDLIYTNWKDYILQNTGHILRFYMKSVISKALKFLLDFEIMP